MDPPAGDASTRDDPPRAPPGREVRFGPFVWVPGLRASSPDDPWAHRKGEPRPLALLWAMYLMASSLLTIFMVRSLTAPTTAQFVYGCRAMIIMIVLGATVLWPMLRLSQETPARPRRAVLADLGVVLAPVQAVVWPMPLLTHWPLSVTGGLSLMVASWTALVSGLLALCFAGGVRSRALCMLGAAALAGGAPLLALTPPGAAVPARAMEMLSPVTAVIALTRAPGGLRPVMQAWEWGAAAAPLLPALALWAAAGRGSRRAVEGDRV